jgi:transposase InsO family protein
MDLCTRYIRVSRPGRSLEQELTITALERALERGVPEIHYSDQGVHYAAAAYVATLRDRGVAISMA